MTRTNNSTKGRSAQGTHRTSEYVTDKTGRTWKRIKFGDLREGYYIPDENGNPTRITVAYPTHTPQTMIEFTTPTGTFTVGGTHLLYIETGEDQALHAHRLATARNTLAPLMNNPGVKATLETIAHHADTESATNQNGADMGENAVSADGGASAPPIPGSALTFRDTCTPEELYDATLASWDQYAHYLNKQQDTGPATPAETGENAGKDSKSDDGSDGAGETTTTGEPYLGDTQVSDIAATIALETHRCARSIGPLAEDTTLGYTGPDSEHTTQPVSATQLAQQLLAVCKGGEWAKKHPPIIGRVITALEAEQLLSEGHTLHIPNPPETR